MNEGKTDFPQAISLLPNRACRRFVTRYGGDRTPRRSPAGSSFAQWLLPNWPAARTCATSEACLGAFWSQVGSLGFWLCGSAFHAMDRGYFDFEWLSRFTLESAFVVVRTKTNVLLQRRYPRPVDKTTGPRSDHTVILTPVHRRGRIQTGSGASPIATQRPPGA